MSIRATIQDETTKIQEYIRNLAPSDELLNQCLRHLAPGKGGEVEEEPSLKDKPLHGMYFRQIEDVAEIEKSYQWLEKVGQNGTEALIMAAQEQALSIEGQSKRLWTTTSEVSQVQAVKSGL